MASATNQVGVGRRRHVRSPDALPVTGDPAVAVVASAAVSEEASVVAAAGKTCHGDGQRVLSQRPTGTPRPWPRAGMQSFVATGQAETCHDPA